MNIENKPRSRNMNKKYKKKGSASLPKKAFRCKICSYLTFVKARFTKHVKYHSMPFIKCEHCDFKTPYKWNLDRHYKNHNGDGSLKCPLCNFTCDIKQSLTVHIQNHHETVPENIGELMRQSLGHIEPMPISEIGNKRRTSSETEPETKNILTKKFYKCKFCDFNALSEQGLMQHTKQSHKERRKSVNLLKPMPNLIPIPPSKSSREMPAAEAKITGCVEAGEDLQVKSEASDSASDSFQEKSAFLQYFSLTPKVDDGNERQESGGEGQEHKRAQRVPKRRTSFFEKLTQKLIANGKQEDATSISNASITITSNSTRCQYCRHRCKTSVDLISHLGQCAAAKQYLEMENEEEDKQMYWNQSLADIDGGCNAGESYGADTLPANNKDQEGAECITKSRKVYKCPQQNCSFWATTASRFHVHIVGHYNLKPFECSQCSYRSNWRWDITKHIKLKTMRDPAHTKAKVLLTHESGQRNYRKYDRYLVPMDVKYSADSKLPDCSTVASKRTDVELCPPSSSNSELGASSPGRKRRDISSSPTGEPHTEVKMKMPKLTKAPENSWGGSNALANPPVVPPPVLKPIISISPVISDTSNKSRRFVDSRILAGGEILNTELTRSAISISPISSDEKTSETKTMLWKCKRCSFKSSSKDGVINHINSHHRPKFGESISILNHNNFEPFDSPQSNNSEEEKHDGSEGEENKTINGISKLLPCIYCTEKFGSRRDLKAHLKSHGSEHSGDESINPGFDSGIISPDEVHSKPRGPINDGLVYKKYHCKECPYVTDSKGQFVYHKRFHIPSDDAQFQCNKCSYRVSHKHLLHQHIRVHAIEEGLRSDDECANNEDPNCWINQSLAAPGSLSAENENRPKVLVWKGGKPYKMYRCRFCPQVFSSVSDLSDHEETHEDTNQDYPEEAINLSIRKNNEEPKHVRDSSCGSLLAQQLSLPFEKPTKMSTPSQAVTKTVLFFCEECPARFFYEKELRIHHTFHVKLSDHQCALCSYSAKQLAHLMSHMKVHGLEYQSKTATLLAKYPSAGPVDFSNDIASAFRVPISIAPVKSSDGKKSQNNIKFQDSSISCKKCPAKFNNISSFVQHTQNHGRGTGLICRYCDFGTDSKNNLMLHEILHAGSEITIEPEPLPDILTIPTVIPQLIRSKGRYATTESNSKDHQGNPEFIYPTYIKNGRIKSKRYKCFKCPSAFEKRDQYKVHIGLHGSNQRYKCTVCDYAVTYYANFIQHLKKHKNQPNVNPQQLIAKPLSKIQKESNSDKVIKGTDLTGPENAETESKLSDKKDEEDESEEKVGRVDSLSDKDLDNGSADQGINGNVNMGVENGIILYSKNDVDDHNNSGSSGNTSCDNNDSEDEEDYEASEKRTLARGAGRLSKT